MSNFPLLVFDQLNRKFLPLTIFYKNLVQQLSEGTAITYLNSLLPFFSWLYKNSNHKGKIIDWDAPFEVVQEAIVDYLTHKLACKIRDHINSNKIINLTSESPKTIQIFLSALKKFYGMMIREKLYLYSNPLLEQELELTLNEFTAEDSETRPKMPDIAGTEPRNRQYVSDSYFKLTGNQWMPEIIDDVQLPAKVFKGGEIANWSLREKLIARMMFECGARISEILLLTIGDYRRRPSTQEFATFNKGSNGRRVKFIRFSNETIILFNRYVNTERKKHDPYSHTFNDLQDDAAIFLTQRGTPYNYHSWYPHWRRGCMAANILLNPHKTRHWYVTQALREIFESTELQSELQRKINQLIEYMKWKDKETIHVYQHYFDAKQHREIQDKLFKKLEAETNLIMESYEKRKGLSKTWETNQVHKKDEPRIANDFLTDFFS
ncbi:tyrosine-type recombinase/integrase [Paenibacillus alvei]